MMHRGSSRAHPTAAGSLPGRQAHRRASCPWVVRALTATLLAVSTAAPASVFYKFNVVAETPTGGFVSFGNGPSVNDKGKVAFVGRLAASGNESVYLWTPIAGLTDIAPGFHPQNRSFGESVRINNNDEVLAWTRILPSGNYEVRVFRSATPNDNSIMVRGLAGSAAPYDLLYQNPAMNNTRVLEDRALAQPGNKDGICDAGETCVSQIAFNAPRLPTRFLGTVVKNPTDATDSGAQHETVLNTSQSRPMMSDDGRIVIRGVNATDPILLFNYVLASPTTIAGSGSGFTALGVAPSISADGKIIAFAGNRGHGDGIFLSIDQSNIAAGQRRLVRIVGENATVQKSELGFDASNSKLYMQSIELDSRVGIIYTPGENGTPNQSVVVSFIGTPNAASRTNPGSGNPFAFSNQKGLWTIRIDLNAALYRNICVVRAPGSGLLPTPKGDDQLITPGGATPPYIVAGTNGICETENTDTNETLFSRSSVLPVVQIGDTITSTAAHTVSSISVNDPIAQANFDNALVPRTERIGDHRVAFYAQVDGGAKQMIVRGEQLDSDQDGLYDHWETEGIDLDGTGSIDLDLPGMGADPFKRDVFLQIDWGMDRPTPLNFGAVHRTAPLVIRQLAQFYAAAPALPNGISAGIQLHVDAGTGKDGAQQFFSRNMGIGPLRGGKIVSAPGNQPIDILYFGLPGTVNPAGVNAVDFDSVKATNFWAFHRGAREFAFIHIVWADFHHALGTNGGDNNANPIVGTVTAGDTFVLKDANNPALGQVSFGGHGIKITSGTGAGQLRRISQSGLFGTTPGLNVEDAWTTIPDSTSQYIIFDGSSGEGQAGERYDGSFAPGRNLSITLGAFPRFSPGNYMGTFLDQWQTLAHEIGHLSTLKHGGTDHDNYKGPYVSLMNYAYQLCPAGSSGTDGNNNPIPGAAACPINSYSGNTDPVFPDWQHLDFSVNFRRLGQAFGAETDPPVSPFPPPPRETQTWRTITDRFGPMDTQAPTVQISTPVAGASISLGSTVPVSFTATDNDSVTNAEVLFDVNGDGVIDDVTETFAATFTSPSTFTVTIPAVSGPAGTRTLTAVAFDPRGNPGVSNIKVNVGVVAPTTVPNVVGQAEAMATSAIATAGLDIGTITRQTSPSVPLGSVISQNPAGGQSRPPGTFVNLVISTGTNGVVVPAVVGLSQAAASSAITGAGLVVGTVTQNLPSSDPPDTVLGQSPAASQVVASGSAVQLLVSQSVGGVIVPDVVGLTQAAATTAINNAGLVVGTITQQTSATVPAGDVISQNPLAGTSVASGSAVALVISTGTTASPPAFVSAVSRKVHGAAGAFNLALSAVPTNPTTEPRQGPLHTIIFTFDKAINAATASINEGVATAAAPTFSGNDVIVALTGVSNQQYVTIALTNVASVDGGTGGSGSVRVGLLLGDVNQNRVVTVADLGLVNAQLAQVVTAANYLKDVNKHQPKQK